MRTNSMRTNSTRTTPKRADRNHDHDHGRHRGQVWTRRLALAAVCVGGALATPSAALAVDDGPGARRTLETLCVAHGGSFHVNTHDGVNLICSAPLHLGDFAAARAACDRLEGDFSHTTVHERRASWFCHRPAG